MNRRGFFGLVGKLLAVGTAMSVAPSVMKPAQAWVRRWTATLPSGETFECVVEFRLAC